jgi:hypothetical protein
MVRTATHDRVDQHGERRHEIDDSGHGDRKLVLQARKADVMVVRIRGLVKYTGGAPSLTTIT